MPSLTLEELERCLSACTFGKFQYALMAIAFVAHNANAITATNISFIGPAAECDIGLDINDRGLLQSMHYFGMIASGFLAGFLTDTFGRKKTLKYGYMAVFVAMAFESLSQNLIMLACGKFAEGFIVNAVTSANLAMVSEFHAKPTRDKMIILLSSFFSWGHITSTLMAWVTLPYDLTIVISNGVLDLKFYNWNFYVLLCSFWSLSASLLYSRFPESPKFLFTHGKEEEAMELLKRIYVRNTGKSPESYYCANIEVKNEPVLTSHWQSFRHKLGYSFELLKPLCHKPLSISLFKLILLFFLLMTSYNTMRNWYPSISTILENYKPLPGQPQDNICHILDGYMQSIKNKEINDTAGPCITKPIPDRTFQHSLMMGAILLLPYIVGGVLIVYLGRNKLLQACLIICACCIIGLYWTKTAMQVTSLFSVFVALTQLAINVSQILTVAYFPTTMRTLTISLAMMFGRAGSLFGNILFPILLGAGCMTPFLAIGAMMICSIALVLTLPSKGEY